MILDAGAVEALSGPRVGGREDDMLSDSKRIGCKWLAGIHGDLVVAVEILIDPILVNR